MKFKIHGTRGSVPNANEKFIKYGGNTTCFEISTKNQQIFFDAGTGFISADLCRETKDIFVFFSHFHHDHVQGFPFNPGLFREGGAITLTSALCDKDGVAKIIQKYFSGPYFPIDIFATIKSLSVENFSVTAKKLRDGLTVDSMSLNHPGGAMGYKFSYKTKNIVIILDNEFYSDQEAELISFCKNADLLVWDAMFTDKELAFRRGWGHSSVEQAENFSKKANIKKTILSHHAPHRSDSEIDFLSEKLGSSQISFGYEKMCFSI